MTHNPKAFGLALVAAFAMTAVLASAAQAQIKFTVGSAPSWLTGEVIEHPVIGKKHTIVLPGGQVVSCEEVKFIATVANAATSITVIPSYTNCSINISGEVLPVTFTMNDCDYTFHGGKEVSSTTFSEGELDLTCDGAIKKVEIHVYKKAKRTSLKTKCAHFPSPHSSTTNRTNTTTSPDRRTT
jgi:hypothetical protein